MTAVSQIVLASSSPYRRTLLARLGIDCRALAPQIDERALPGETPAATALRLAQAKAQRIADMAPAALIIGSDQVAVLDGRLLGKPGSHAAATRQLQALRGRTVIFHTALCLLNAATGTVQIADVPTTVRFRGFDDAQIERYLLRDRPYDCAGSAKIEALGITLVEQLESSDPTALVGLPLIALTGMLAREGVILP